MGKRWDVVIIGSGNAALCAGIAACELGADVLMIEKADRDMAGGNTKYTAGAMRFSYETSEDLHPLLARLDDPRIARADFGSYTQEKFAADLSSFNDGAYRSAKNNRFLFQKAMKLCFGLPAMA